MSRSLLHDRWDDLCRRIGAFDRVEHSDLTFELVETLYATPPRAYHNLDHVERMLGVLDEVRRLADEPDQVELAVWLHDCVYEADKDDNEDRSAETASMIAGLLGCEPDFVARVRALILATHHTDPPPAGDESLVADLDLSILAAPQEVYDAYAAGVREEFAFVGPEQFRAGRAAFLERMLGRRRIYSTNYFRANYERAARANMDRELDRLHAEP